MNQGEIGLNLKQKAAAFLLKTEFGRNAVREEADLSMFRERPDLKITFGLFLIAISYVIGWPAVGVLGTISLYCKEPLIIAIGGPLVYGFSHLVFLGGMFLAGSRYAKAFSKWLTRMLIQKLNS
jgi:hypothetical protein